MSSKRYILLDRDGTINAERNYLSHPDQVELLPGAAAGLRRLQRGGFGLVVVTNQSGLARGYFDEDRLAEIHERLRSLLAGQGVTLDGIYICPHLPGSGCDCRKPRPGLVRQAAADLGFSMERCFLIGDKPCDIDLGKNVGARTVLVRTGYGAMHERDEGLAPDHVVDDLVGAAEVVEREIGAEENGENNDNG